MKRYHNLGAMRILLGVLTTLSLLLFFGSCLSNTKTNIGKEASLLTHPTTQIRKIASQDHYYCPQGYNACGKKFLELCTSKNDEFKNCINKIEKIEDVHTCEESVFRPHRELVEKKFPKLNLRGFIWTAVGERILVCLENEEIHGFTYLEKQLSQKVKNCIVDTFFNHINRECQKLEKLLEK